jgi:hypothetical protein
MYPDKVGRVVLDGVYDAASYRTATWSTNLEDTDAVIKAFFYFCHRAGPSKCQLYDPSVAKIQHRVDVIIDSLSQAPIPIPFAPRGPIVMTKEMLQMLTFKSTYVPIPMFEVLADTIIAIETHNLTALPDIIERHLDSSVRCDCERTYPWLEANQAMSAISCGDGDEVMDEPGRFETHFETGSEIVTCGSNMGEILHAMRRVEDSCKVTIYGSIHWQHVVSSAPIINQI